MEHDQHDIPSPVSPSGLRAVLGGLQCKATVLVVALTLSVTAVVAGYLLREAARSARELHTEKLVQLCKMVAHAGSEPMRAGDADVLQSLAREFAQGDPLLYVAFSDAQGREVARAARHDMPMLEWLRLSGAGRSTEVGVARRCEGSPAGTPVMDMTYPVQSIASPHGSPGVWDRPLAGSPLLGYVRVGTDADLWRIPLERTTDLIVGVGVIAVAIAIPLGFGLVRRIVIPIDSLSLAMRRFSEGKLDVRSPVRRGDEIGQLALAFNRMADQHQKTHERIVRLNAELEERVARRTRQLHELASRDPLTALYNRRHFNDVLDRDFSLAVRHDADLSCVMVDLDDFKAVNDSFGHHVGDEVLMLLAKTITSQLRAEDVAARFGGDELVVLLPQTDADRARVLAERVCERFAVHLAQQLPGVRTSLSMGIASRKGVSAADVKSLVRAADAAMYEAKQAGKHCIVTAEPAPVAA